MSGFAPSINFLNLQILQHNVVHSPHVDRTDWSLEYVVQVYSVDHVHTTYTTETVERPLETKEIVCEFAFCAQHIDSGNWWVDPHIHILLVLHVSIEAEGCLRRGRGEKESKRTREQKLQLQVRTSLISSQTTVYLMA
jgi:hypothetical protein